MLQAAQVTESGEVEFFYDGEWISLEEVLTKDLTEIEYNFVMEQEDGRLH